MEQTKSQFSNCTTAGKASLPIFFSAVGQFMGAGRLPQTEIASFLHHFCLASTNRHLRRSNMDQETEDFAHRAQKLKKSNRRYSQVLRGAQKYSEVAMWLCPMMPRRSKVHFRSCLATKASLTPPSCVLRISREKPQKQRFRSLLARSRRAWCAVRPIKFIFPIPLIDLY